MTELLQHNQKSPLERRVNKINWEVDQAISNADKEMAEFVSKRYAEITHESAKRRSLLHRLLSYSKQTWLVR